MAIAMPAWCPTCNAMVDGSGGIHIENSTHVTLEDCTITCPKCWGTARIIEGTFNVRDGIIDVVTASPWTRAKLAEFQSALRWAIGNFDRDPAAAATRLTAANPEMAPFLQRMIFESWSRTDVIAALALLVAIISAVLAARGGGDTVYNITTVDVDNYLNSVPPNSVAPSGDDRSPTP